MITGTTQADVALLVTDATRGEFETGFESGGQTREHALLARSLGVNQLGVVINKLDTVDWSQDRFLEIRSKLGSFLKSAGFRESDVTYIPCSGLTGQNLVTAPTEDSLLKWYKGPCLLEVIGKYTFFFNFNYELGQYQCTGDQNLFLFFQINLKLQNV